MGRKITSCIMVTAKCNFCNLDKIVGCVDEDCGGYPNITICLDCAEKLVREIRGGVTK